ncbi:HD domain-containing protein [Candidatus Kaiserbacteria bacterium]|nr:HD domain-containing protein [Candidatus Kaiserbacteria bacterium]
MTYTPRIELAVQTAAVLHRTQIRKGQGKLPYVTHPFSVYAILRDHTDDEDVLIAGLLHDALEDTPYTPDNLEKNFGPRVREIVEGVTQKTTRDGKELDWVEQKKLYIEHLKSAPKESAMVAAADKVHNFRSVFDEYRNDVARFKKDFTLQDRIRFYQMIVDVISSRLGDTPLVATLRKTYDEYRTFLEQ